MFLSDGGSGVTESSTENAKPCAWPCVGYGSCPKMTTEVESIDRVNDLKIFENSGLVSIPSSERSILDI